MTDGSTPNGYAVHPEPAALRIERLLPGDAEEAEPHSGVRHHEKDYAGGVVALDARVINNIVVRSIADELLEQIDEEVPDEPEVPLA